MTRWTAASRTVQAEPGIGTAVSGSDSTRAAVRADTTDSAVRTSSSMVVSAIIPALARSWHEYPSGTCAELASSLQALGVTVGRRLPTVRSSESDREGAWT